MEDDQWARRISEHYLAHPLPQRWSHVRAMADRARIVSASMPVDQTLFKSAVWLHDIGYSPCVRRLGFHPVDGAVFLKGQGCSQRLCSLVAFHSSALSEAEVLSLTGELDTFEDERTLTRDLLWYLDMTTGPDGTLVSLAQRMAEVRERYPVDHYVIRALDVGMPERIAAVERAEVWLASVGLAGQV